MHQLGLKNKGLAERGSMHKIGIVGYTGMVGQEIQKVLKNHDQVEIVYKKNSTGEEGNLKDCEIVFLATKDLESMQFSKVALEADVKVIDMSGAYRLDQASFEKWYGLDHIAPELLNTAVYGMPALYREKIKAATLVANPGCYATSVILALYPLQKLLKNDGNIVVVSTSGNSGARRECDEISDDFTYSYGRKHKHVPEMERYSGFTVEFTPIVLRSVFKGINTNIRAHLNDELAAMTDAQAKEIIEQAIRDCYCEEDRVFVVRDDKEHSYGTKAVNDTHDVLLKVRVEDGKVYINSLIDNLMKGAASQGVENMNLLLGLDRLYGIVKEG